MTTERKYTIESDSNGRYLIFKNDAEKYYILNSKEYGEYVLIKNPYDKSGSFNGKLKDAFTAFKNGLGDYLDHKDYHITHSIKLYYYLDRNIAKERKEFIEEHCKDSKFGYYIDYLAPDEWGLHIADTKGNLSRYGEFIGYSTDKLMFDKENEALDQIDKFINNAESLLDGYSNIEDRMERLEKIYLDMDSEKYGTIIDKLVMLLFNGYSREEISKLFRVCQGLK